MKNRRINVLLFVMVMCIFTMTGCSKKAKTYENAVEEAVSGSIDKSIELFSELPGSYCPKSAYLTADDWIHELKEEYNPSFAGKWKGSATNAIGERCRIELNIDCFISENSGVVFYYRMYTWTQGGTMVSNNGDLQLSDSNKAKFINGDKANSKYYEIELLSHGEMVLLFKGQEEATLYRERK